jgi:hypothetical protein
MIRRSPGAIGTVPNAAQRGRGVGYLTLAGGSPPPPQPANDPLEQLAVGTAGSGDYAGYKVAQVDTFNEPISQLLLHPAQLNGGTPGTLYNNFSERDRRRPFSAQTYCLVDQFFTGWKDQGDGVQMASAADILATAGGVIRSRHRHATAEETAMLGARTNERGPTETTIECVTAHPTWYGRWAILGPAILEARYRVVPPAGYTLPANVPAAVQDGLNPHSAFWDCHARGGSEAANVDLGGGLRAGGECDYIEMSLINGVNFRASGVGGSTSSGNLGIVHDGNWNVVQVNFGPSAQPTKAVLRALEDDLATARPGTATVTPNYDLQGTIADGTGNLEEPRYIMFGSLNEDQNSAYPGVLDHTKWIGKQMDTELSAVRVWIPSGSKVVAPIITPWQINQVEYRQSGTEVITFPAAVDIWGAGTWTEMMRGVHAIDVNGPGRAGGTLGDYVAPLFTRTQAPFGLSQDLTARTITLTMANFCAQWPGLIIMHLFGWDATTGVLKPYRIFVCVKPRVAIPAPPLAVASTAYSHTIPRDDGAGTRYWTSGNIPKPNAANGGLAIEYLPAWLSFNAGTRALTGTAPATLDDIKDRVIVSVENAAGGKTEQELDLVWTPRGVSNLTYVLDSGDTNTVPGAHGDRPARAYNRFGPRALAINTTWLSQTTEAQRPAIKTNGGIGGTYRVLNMTGACYDGGESNPSSTFQDFVDGSNISTAGPYYFALGFKLNAAASQDIVRWQISSNARFWGLFTNASSRLIFRYVGQGGSNVDFDLAAADTNWHTIEVKKVGATLDIWLDGVQVVTGHTITQTGSIDTNIFRLGGNTAGDPAMDGDVSRFVMQKADPGSDQANIRTYVARRHGQVL